MQERIHVLNGWWTMSIFLILFLVLLLRQKYSNIFVFIMVDTDWNSFTSMAIKYKSPTRITLLVLIESCAVVYLCACCSRKDRTFFCNEEKLSNNIQPTNIHNSTTLWNIKWIKIETNKLTRRDTLKRMCFKENILRCTTLYIILLLVQSIYRSDNIAQKDYQW